MTVVEPGMTGNSPLRAWALDFDAAWPSARARIAAVLGARGLQCADVDDVAQEVAVRALRQRGTFGSYEHFVRWCCRVAINLQVDTARRQRRLDPSPPPDVAGHHDTAASAQRRMALEAVAAGIAELTPEERRLLFEQEPTASRREAVRLAVRRHRLRARLAALMEGLAAGFPAVRRLSRSLSTPAKVGLAAVPVVVAGLLVVPGLRTAPRDRPVEIDRPVSWAPSPSTDAVGRDRPGAQTARAPAAAAPSRRIAPSPRPTAAMPERTLVQVNHPALPPVRVWQDRRPDDQPVFCVWGHVNTCVKQPGPLAEQLPAVAPQH